MISFRQHVVTLIAVFVALAIGIVLGGGPLTDLSSDAVRSVSGDAADGTDRATRAAYQAEIDHAGQVAQLLAGDALADRLAGQAVAIVRTPGADPETVAGLEQSVRAAGGAVSGVWTLQEALLAPAEKSLVEAMTSQLATQLGDAALGAAEASTYVRAGHLLGRAVATTAEAPTAADAPAGSVRDTFERAGLVSPPDSEASLAPLVLVVLGAEEDEARDPILDGILSGLTSPARGVVVSAPAAAARAGVLQRLRDRQSGIGSTVDGIETAVGQVTAVLALVAAMSGTVGDFGASGADGTPSLG